MTQWQSKRFRHPLFSHNSSTVVFLSVFAWVVLGWTRRPLHFGLPHSNQTSYSKLPYLIWKRGVRAFIWAKNTAIVVSDFNDKITRRHLYWNAPGMREKMWSRPTRRSNLHAEDGKDSRKTDWDCDKTLIVFLSPGGDSVLSGDPKFDTRITSTLNLSIS